jgi:hypothetical protein
VTHRITGVEDTLAALRTLKDREAINLIRATNHDVAKQLAVDAKSNMAGLQDSGDMIAGTRADRRRGTKEAVRSTVGVAGAFYWRFLEYGQGPDRTEHAMFLKALQKMGAVALEKFLASFARKFEQAAARKAKRGG